MCEGLEFGESLTPPGIGRLSVLAPWGGEWGKMNSESELACGRGRPE